MRKRGWPLAQRLGAGNGREKGGKLGNEGTEVAFVIRLDIVVSSGNSTS